jgi:hypothetical protein
MKRPVYVNICIYLILQVSIDVAVNTFFFAFVLPSFVFYILSLTQRLLNLTVVLSGLYVSLPNSAIFPLPFYHMKLYQDFSVLKYYHW